MLAAKFSASLMVVLVATVRVAHAQEKIKICGRDLIRLAVSSCGESRLTRSIPDKEQKKNQYTFQWDQESSYENPLATPVTLPTPESEIEKDGSTMAPHWYPVSSRIRRAAGKIPDICCEEGCSVKELIQFC